MINVWIGLNAQWTRLKIKTFTFSSNEKKTIGFVAITEKAYC